MRKKLQHRVVGETRRLRRAGQKTGRGEAGGVDGQDWVQLPVDGAETMGARLRQRTERPCIDGDG